MQYNILLLLRNVCISFVSEQSAGCLYIDSHYIWHFASYACQFCSKYDIFFLHVIRTPPFPTQTRKIAIIIIMVTDQLLCLYTTATGVEINRIKRGYVETQSRRASSSKLRGLNSELQGVQKIMFENIDAALQRGELVSG